MNNNRMAKEALIERYGDKCFIERLHLRDTKGIKYKGYGQYKKMKMLTYHHIVMKKDGGKATVENGALLSSENHEWFHRQPKKAQDEMNAMFQELKKNMDECRVECVDDVEVPFKIGFAEVSVDKNGVYAKRIKEDKKRQEKREMQRLKKEWEDR